MMFSILFMTLILTPFCFGIEVDAGESILSRVTALEAKTDGLQKSLKTQEAEIESLKSVPAMSGTVFFATFSDWINPVQTPVSIIVWDKATINPGGHYNTSTGGYTAPYDGYYQFSVAKTSNKFSAYFWINIGRKRYFFNQVNSYQEQIPTSTATVNLKLKKGEVVTVENFFSTQVYGINSGEIKFINSFFTRYLIAAL